MVEVGPALGAEIFDELRVSGSYYVSGAIKADPVKHPATDALTRRLLGVVTARRARSRRPVGCGKCD